MMPAHAAHPAKAVPPKDCIRVIVATDCGSTTTKAILIEESAGHFRQTQRGEAPTTVEAPFADVTLGTPGVRHRDPVAALHALMALCGIERVEVQP